MNRFHIYKLSERPAAHSGFMDSLKVSPFSRAPSIEALNPEEAPYVAQCSNLTGWKHVGECVMFATHAFLFGNELVGRWLASRLFVHHLDDETNQMVPIAMHPVLVPQDPTGPDFATNQVAYLAFEFLRKMLMQSSVKDTSGDLFFGPGWITERYPKKRAPTDSCRSFVPPVLGISDERLGFGFFAKNFSKPGQSGTSQERGMDPPLLFERLGTAFRSLWGSTADPGCVSVLCADDRDGEYSAKHLGMHLVDFEAERPENDREFDEHFNDGEKIVSMTFVIYSYAEDPGGAHDSEPVVEGHQVSVFENGGLWWLADINASARSEEFRTLYDERGHLRQAVHSQPTAASPQYFLYCLARDTGLSNIGIRDTIMSKLRDLYEEVDTTVRVLTNRVHLMHRAEGGSAGVAAYDRPSAAPRPVDGLVVTTLAGNAVPVYDDVVYMMTAASAAGYEFVHSLHRLVHTHREAFEVMHHGRYGPATAGFPCELARSLASVRYPQSGRREVECPACGSAFELLGGEAGAITCPACTAPLAEGRQRRKPRVGGRTTRNTRSRNPRQAPRAKARQGKQSTARATSRPKSGSRPRRAAVQRKTTGRR